MDRVSGSTVQGPIPHSRYGTVGHEAPSHKLINSLYPPEVASLRRFNYSIPSLTWHKYKAIRLRHQATWLHCIVQDHGRGVVAASCLLSTSSQRAPSSWGRGFILSNDSGGQLSRERLEFELEGFCRFIMSMEQVHSKATRASSLSFVY